MCSDVIIALCNAIVMSVVFVGLAGKSAVRTIFKMIFYGLILAFSSYCFKLLLKPDVVIWSSKWVCTDKVDGDCKQYTEGQ